ncbi:UvrD-helicase domain-containing protein [Niallia circulans]|uniref:UvrD-helicase domain-containing protein n=1 Tax=Niallia circulans TaxID=1397 RepID=UPI001F3CF37E|nr:ATP-dependent helicase [Niallia circulans]MCF2650590.1 ATP-dependent helicase [Niallia circulans]
MTDNDNFRKSIVNAPLTQSIVVQAGPGSGKTSLLIQRLKYIIGNRPMSFSGIACITYTNAAKDEIIGRLQKERVQIPAELFIGTIHSFLLENVIKPFSHFARKDRIPYKLAPPGFARIYKNEIINIMNIQNYFIDESTLKAFDSLGRDENGDPCCFMSKISPKDARKWKDFLKEKGYIDQQDVIYLSYLILNKYQHIRKAISSKYPFILVDEFQDVTYYQDKIFTVLENSAFFFVGDKNQSIFSFTGAKPEYFQSKILEKKFLNYNLTNNYRSTKHIVKFANRKTNVQQVEAGDNASSKQKVIFIKNIEDLSEVISLFQSIRKKVKHDEKLNPYMILARKNEYLSNISHLIQKQNVEFNPFLKKLSKEHYRRFKILQNILLAISHKQDNQFEESVESMAEALSYLIFNEHPSFVSLEEIGYNKFMWKKLQIFTIHFLIGLNLKETSVESLFIQLKEFLSEQSKKLYGKSIGNKLRMLSYNWKNQVKASRKITILELLEDTGKYNKSSDFQSHVFNIHTAKGQEAECVLVIAESEYQLLEWLGDNNDSEEARVGYVAFSRARKLLCVWAPFLQEDTYKYLKQNIEFVDSSYYGSDLVIDEELINS